MVTIDAKDIAKNFGEYRQKALVEPVKVQHYKRDSVVILNNDEYERLKKLDRQVMAIEELSRQDIDLLKSTKMSATHDDLNDLLD